MWSGQSFPTKGAWGVYMLKTGVESLTAAFPDLRARWLRVLIPRDGDGSGKRGPHVQHRFAGVSGSPGAFLAFPYCCRWSTHTWIYRPKNQDTDTYASISRLRVFLFDEGTQGGGDGIPTHTETIFKILFYYCALKALLGYQGAAVVRLSPSHR